MLLSKRTSIKVSREYANLIGHMCYAASKLWNVCNYERQHYKETGIEQYPDWYYQKKAHKEDLWYKQLPSQTAQEVCKLLDKAWKSFYALKRSGGIETPRPPRFKQESIPITYMQMGIVHERDTDRVRLSLPKALKKYMEETYQIQLCAQAMCMEEMFHTTIPEGALFFISSHRRMVVPLDTALRSRTEELAQELHQIRTELTVPPAVYSSKCRRCSLNELCMPKVKASAESYLQQLRREAAGAIEENSK